MADRKTMGSIASRQLGSSGLWVPEMSLSFSRGFGKSADPDMVKGLIQGAFERGITAYDLSNNFGPPAGAAEKLFGKIFRKHLKSHRDEILITTRTGTPGWEGPYGEGGSRKHLFSSVDHSLKRLGVSFVDILFHHGPDPRTPIEETGEALVDILRAGKCLYLGLCSYPVESLREMVAFLVSRQVKPIALRYPYNLIESGRGEGIEAHFSALEELGMGMMAAAPMAHGLLTAQYLSGWKSDRLEGEVARLLPSGRISENFQLKLLALNALAEKRGETLAGMALSWALRRKEVATVLTEVDREEHLRTDVEAVENRRDFSQEDLDEIDRIVASRLGGAVEEAEAEEFSVGGS
ncbi:MAG: aldo/keto reductase [Puniceicoccaceae bacterium]